MRCRPGPHDVPCTTIADGLCGCGCCIDGTFCAVNAQWRADVDYREEIAADHPQRRGY